MATQKFSGPQLPLAASICVHLGTSAVLLGYGIFHLLYGSLAVGISCSITLVLGIVSLLASFNSDKKDFYLLAFVFGLTTTVVTTSYLFGVRGLIYCFPLSSVLFFMLGYRIALAGGVLICLLSLAAATQSLEISMVLRFAVALAMSLVFSATLAYQVFKHQARLEKEAGEDYLTGLMNQRSFYNWLENYLLDPKLQNAKLTLYYFDIDNFKSVNDAFGHEGGDRVLKEIATRVTEVVQILNNEFCATADMHFCRISGDEFVLACTSTRDREMAINFATRFHDAVSQPFEMLGQQVKVGSSIGVHHFTVRHQKVSQVMRLADEAMYEAKKQGKQQFCIAD